MWSDKYFTVIAVQKLDFGIKNLKQYIKVLPVFLPLIAQFGIMILAPVASVRYAWPLFLLLPIGLIVVWYSDEEEKLSDVKEEVEKRD